MRHRRVEALVGALAASIDDGGPLPLCACSACKCVLSELPWEALDRMMQVLGRRGYLETSLAPQQLRHARVLRIPAGPGETLYAHLGALLRFSGNPLAQAVARCGSDEPPAATARGEAAAWVARHALAIGATEQAALAIGATEQAAPGEAHRLAALLRRAVPEKSPPQPASPAGPSSLELVQACLPPNVDIYAGEGPGAACWSADTPFSDFGIDSPASLPLALETEQASGLPVCAELPYDYPTVRLSAGHIDAQRGAQRDGQRPHEGQGAAAATLPAGSASG